MGPSASSRSPFDWEALARYVTGESPADEGATVRAWLVAHPGDAALVAALDRTLVGAADHARDTAARAPIDVDLALRRLAARRDASAPAVRSIASARARLAAARPAPRRVAMLAAAAAVAVVVAGGALLREAGRAGTEGVARAVAPAARTVATAVGRRDSVRLPDGTRVVLAPDSRLTVAAGYGVERREVALRGTAYFDVAHADARPFTVRVGGAVVRDVGTAFTVRAEDRETRVAVTAGSVELATPGDAGAELLLHRGDVGALDADGRLVARRGGVPDDELAWTAGRLVFRDAPLGEVRSALRHWYGVELRVDDRSLAGRRLTASFEGEPADRVLEVIGLALGARLERRGDGAYAPARGGAAR